MGWRYQPVWVDMKLLGTDEMERVYSLIEVYLDDNDRLERWAAEPHYQWPKGETIEELQSDLAMMHIEALCWEPVSYVEMAVGMELKLVSSEGVREALQRDWLTAPANKHNKRVEDSPQDATDDAKGPGDGL